MAGFAYPRTAAFDASADQVADGASYAPADQPTEQADVPAAPEFADLTGEEAFDLAA